MAVKSSGALSFTEIVTEFGGATPHSMSEYVRGGAYVPNGPAANANIPTNLGGISFSQFYSSVRAFVFNQTLAGTTIDYNLKNAAIAAGWDQVTPLLATITINSGVVVGASSTGAWAFNTGSTFSSGTVLTLNNYGYIVGAGGIGGQGKVKHDSSSDAVSGPGGGTAGGPALLLYYPISINNYYGLIGSGGGGGGGGGADAYYGNPHGSNAGFGAGGGGGGAGYYSGVGGAGGGWLNWGHYGGAGSATVAGAGGTGAGQFVISDDGKGAVSYGYSYNGGAGGGLGQAGVTGADGLAGGAAGSHAIYNYGYVTWLSGSGNVYGYVA